MNTTDTVSVTVFRGSGCSAGKQLTNTANATITNNATPNVTITPATPQIDPGGNVGLTASYVNPKASTQTPPASWMWQLQGYADGGVYGSLANKDGTAAASGASFCSTSNAATYTSTLSEPNPIQQTDIVEATAYAQVGCAGTALDSQPGIADVTTLASSQEPSLTITPSSATVQSGDKLAFTAKITNTNGTVSYNWIAPSFGTLTDPSTGQSGLTNYCTSSTTATLTVNAAKVKQPVVDNVLVTAYYGTTCNTNPQAGSPAGAQLTLQERPISRALERPC